MSLLNILQGIFNIKNFRINTEQKNSVQGAFWESTSLHGYSSPVKKSTVDIPHEGLPGQTKITYPVRKSTLSSWDKYTIIQISPIQNPVITNTISSCDECNIILKQIPYPVKTNKITS